MSPLMEFLIAICFFFRVDWPVRSIDPSNPDGSYDLIAVVVMWDVHLIV
jgi:hypothetical protein